MPRAKQLISGSCSCCHALLKLNTLNGTIHKHGPRSNPCPGSGKLPEASSQTTQSQNITYTPSNSEAGSSTQSPITFSKPSSSSNPSLSPYKLAHPMLKGQLIKHIPRSSRQGCSSLLAGLVNEIVKDINNVANWEKLFRFGSVVLTKPNRGGKKRNIANLIGKRISKFPQELDDDSNVTSRNTEQCSKASKNSNPNEYLANLVAAKMEDGNIKSAIRILCSDDKPAKESLETLEALRRKHPQATLDKETLISPNRSDIAPLQVDQADVLEAIRTFPCGSAGGPDGITPQHLKDMSGYGIDGELIKNLTNLINLVLKGNVGAAIAPIFFGGKLIALEKKDGGVRPIAIGYVWRRLVAKCANLYATGLMAQSLAPLQLGVGIKGGAEAAVHTSRRYLQSMDHDKVFVKLDFSNAFNSLARYDMLKSVSNHLPFLYPLCYSAYAEPSILRFGDHSVFSSEGPQQGDPLGPLLFSLTIQPILEKLGSELVIGYLDDISIADYAIQVASDVETVIREAAAMGLKLNATKCEIIVADTTHPPQHAAFNNFQVIESQHAHLLGVPILPGPAVDAALKSRCDDLASALDRLQLIHVHDALILLKNSISIPKLLYTLRTSVCYGNTALDIFDNLLRQGLSNILNLSFSDDQWLQATLPVRDGGLGVRSAASLASSAFLASAASTSELQGLILDRTNVTQDMDHETCLQLWTSSTGVLPPVFPDSHRQRNWDSVVTEKSKSFLLEACTDDHDRARLLASQASHSGDWLNTLPISTCGLRMEDDVIRVAVGFRLGTRLCEPHLCPCGTLVDAYGTHSLSCRRSAGRQLRHRLLNDIIWRSLARAQIPAFLEPPGLFRTDPSKANKRPDGKTLIPWQAGKCLLWDATAPDTLAASHIKKTSKEAGAAAKEAAAKKSAKYDHLSATHIITPVAVETLGPIDQTGLNFLQDIGGRIRKLTGEQKETQYIFQRISVAIQRGNAASFSGSFVDFAPATDLTDF